MSERALDLDHEPAQLDGVAGHAAVVAYVRAGVRSAESTSPRVARDRGSP